VDRAEESAVAVGGDASARQALEAEREAREQGGRVARVLQGWSSSAESLSQRLVALFDTLKRAGLASAHDAALARAWTADLQRVGYRMPAIDDREAREAALRVCQGPVHALSSLAVPEELCSAMSSLSRPLLSIVTAGRNDDYAGMRRNRTQIFLDLVGEFARLGPDVQLELVVAEYNPPAETRSLAAEFRWPREPNLRVRIVTVPREVHAKLKARFGPDTPDLLEFIAKNAAIRAARGEFIVTTNMDDVFNPLVMELLRRRFFTRGVYYLADRKEARPERLYGLARSSYDEVYRDSDVQRFAFNRSDAGFEAAFAELLRRPDMQPTRQAKEFIENPGDFTLMHREDWRLVRGNPEVGTVAWADIWLQGEAAARGLRYVHLHAPFEQAHLSHKGVWQHLRLTPQFDLGPLFRGEGAPRTPNDEHWGLRGEEFFISDEGSGPAQSA
jgi:hypothetical protein